MDASDRILEDDRGASERALRHARESAYAPGEYVEQESFMLAGEIRALAERAGAGPGVSVLDLCCGVAGPGRYIARELRCDYLGIDASPAAVDIARARAGDLPCRFVAGRVPPLPPGEFEVVLLLETMLAFREKAPLLRAVARSLAPGGRFAFTLEEGSPLTDAERERMPAADTVWLTPLDEMRTLLRAEGLRVSWEEDVSRAHLEAAKRLTAAFEADRAAIAEELGHSVIDDLICAHEMWCDWLTTGRVRKFALIAEAG